MALRWSYSARRTLEWCPRQLAFGHVVASHNARDPLRREAYLLRQLHSIRSWQGSLAHTILATEGLADLRAGRPLAPLALGIAAQDLARRQLAFSAAHRYREPGQSKAAAGDAYCALIEHERGEDIGPETLVAVDAALLRCFTNLAGQTAFLELLREGRGHAAETALTLRWGKATVVCAFDLTLLRPDAGLTIVDWKVSQHEESGYEAQLLLYAYMAVRSGRWPGLTADMIDLYEVNLLRDRVHRHRFDGARFGEVEDRVRVGVDALRAALGDGSYARLRLDQLPIAPHERTCAACPFAPLCADALTDEGRRDEALIVRHRYAALPDDLNTADADGADDETLVADGR